jgi:Holliday junction resolvasome RuvABC DNA-binding subunit
MNKSKPTNNEIADVLGHIAELLEVQNANPHRVRAYRNGAERVRNLDMSLTEMVRSGDGESLQELPDIGEGLARVISNYVHKGRSDVLDRLQGETSPEDLFAQVPGIGQTLAERITDQLDINTLEELERTAYDGRLAKVEGFGPKRVRTVRVSLSGMLSRAAQRRARQRSGDQEELDQEQPDVETLLNVDAEYRRKAGANELHKIAPKRFNPEGEAWLPILHTSRNDWDFTVLYSNTARAHKLGKTHDWVVIYYEQNGQEDQATIVTSNQGKLKGERIVRGRESECERYYERKEKLAG